tara:strand:+ start:364 stop:588 length:225 start_codon:yes stop_codon:yes gene_type:complete
MSLDDIIVIFAELEMLSKTDPEEFYTLMSRIAKTWLMIQAISTKVMVQEIEDMSSDDIDSEFMAKIIKDIGGEA